jgi:glutamate--cysteine ligase
LYQTHFNSKGVVLSTLIGKEHNSIIRSEEDLYSYFQGFSKSAQQRKIGLEAEFLAVNPQTGQAAPYEGPGGIQAAFELLSKEFGYQPVLDHGKVIALTLGDTIIGLEPGGQTELSAPPVFSIFELEEQLQRFLVHLHTIEKKIPTIAWIASGIHPFSTLDQIAWVPKHRYRILADYLKDRGKLSHWMMKSTATNQFNFDYTSETDAMEKLRMILSAGPVVSAMFANASFSEGKLNGYASYRLEIWKYTALDRSGLIPQFLEPGKTFRDYLEYILEMPMIFIVREGEWIPMKGLPFRRYIREGHQGTKPTIGDFELHLSTAFPDARIKQYMEVRGMDCQPPYLIPAMAALWKGLIYDAEAIQNVLKLLSFASPQDLQKLRDEIPVQGLSAKLAGRPLLDLARQIVGFAGQGLSKQRGTPGKNESLFLERLEEKILRPGKSPGEICKEHCLSKQSPEQLIQLLHV